MISDREMFGYVREIVFSTGCILPVLDMDPFSICEREVEFEDGLSIKWCKCLGSGASGEVKEVEKIEIFFEQTNDYMHSENMVFQAILTPRKTVDTFVYEQGKWINEVLRISKSLEGTE